MSKKKEAAGPVPGFVIVDDEKGVFLGGVAKIRKPGEKGKDRAAFSWSSVDQKAKRAPVFATEEGKDLEKLQQVQKFVPTARFVPAQATNGFADLSEITPASAEASSEEPAEEGQDGEGSRRRRRRS